MNWSFGFSVTLQPPWGEVGSKSAIHSFTHPQLSSAMLSEPLHPALPSLVD